LIADFLTAFHYKLHCRLLSANRPPPRMSLHHAACRALSLAALTVALQCGAFAQAPTVSLVGTAKRLPETELLPRLLPGSELARLGVSKPFIVEGEQTFRSGSVLIASEVIFRPGSKLIFAPSNFSQSVEQSVYLIARRVVVEASATPPVITWSGGLLAQRSPPPAGKAAPGAAGYDGSPGGRGADGADGSVGTAGRSPPILYLATKEILGGRIAIDWRGQDGGTGGAGQAGGEGGRGGSGRPASSSLFDCRRGPGDGGRGGDGGNGGSGGLGGRGGDGGLVVFLAMPEDVAPLAERIHLDVSPGAGGFSGPGGLPGNGGTGGERGRAAPPFCRDDARPGTQGDAGRLGSVVDQRGARGAEGAIAIGELTETQARAVGVLQ
jgi:hypothetical protein